MLDFQHNQRPAPAKSTEKNVEQLRAALERARKIAERPVIAALVLIGAFGVLSSLFALGNRTNLPLVYQGRLTDANYLPITDSSRNIRFKIWDASTAGNCVWSTGVGAGSANCGDGDSASAVAVNVNNGNFTVPLGNAGTNNPEILLNFSSGPFYLEVIADNENPVGTYETLSPRKQISGSAYAYTANDLIGGHIRGQGRATAVLTGSIDPTATAGVTGVGTRFLSEISIGDRITVSGETRTVTNISSDTSLSIDTKFSDGANDTSPDVLYALQTVKDSVGVVQFALNDAGRLGIGTSAPQVRLDVIGDIASAGNAWASRTSAADNSWQGVTYGNGLFAAVAATGTGNRVMTSPDGITWTSRTSAADNNWTEIVYGNGFFVAVSQSGTGNRVMTSPDGITWTSRTSAADNEWNSVAYGNGLFVAVSDTGTGNRVMTSPDGITWTIRTSAADNNWNAVTYGNGLFVAIASTGTGDRVMTSPDGITWTSRTSAADNTWTSVTYGNGLFVAVASSGSCTAGACRVMTSPDGITWTIRFTTELGWQHVTYGGGLFVAVSSSGTGSRVHTSPDGISWVPRTSAADNTWNAVEYGDGMFVAVSSTGTGNRVMTSGKTQYIPFSHNNLYQGGMNVFGNLGVGTTTPSAALHVTSTTGPFGIFERNVNGTGANFISMYNPNTTDSTTAYLQWSGDTTGAGATTLSTFGRIGMQYVTHDNATKTGRLVFLLSNNGTEVTRMSVTGSGVEVVGDVVSKGTAWTLRSTGTNHSWRIITYGNGLFVAVGDSGDANRIMTSPDGVNWTERTAPASNLWNSVVYGNGMFVAVSGDGTGNRVMTSPDGITWTSRTSAADNTWRSVTYGNGLFVAVALSGTGNRVMTSPDGITWTSRTSASDNDWSSVTYGNGLFVAVALSGTGNRVMTSPDGITWTSRTSAADNTWLSVTFGQGLFVAVSNDGTGNRVMTSPDGITWTSRTSAADNGWFGVAYGNGTFVAVANSGTGNRVMTSPDGITWTSRTSASNTFWYGIAYGNGMFVATSFTTAEVMTSGKIEYAPFSHNNTYQGGMNIFGNVGIGTTSPAEMLDIQSPLDTFINARLKSTGTRGVPQFIADRGSEGKDQAGLRLQTAGVISWFAGIPYDSGSTTSQFVIGTGINLSNSKFLIDTSGNVGIGSTSPQSMLHVSGSQTFKRTATTGSYSVLVTDFLTAVTGTAGATITLPSAATAAVGKHYIVKDEGGNAGTNNITVTSSSGNIDGAANKLITTNYGSFEFYSDGTNWFSF